METILLCVSLAVGLILLAVSLLTWRRTARVGTLPALLEAQRRERDMSLDRLRQETLQVVQGSVKALGDMLAANLNYAAQSQSQKLGDINLGMQQQQDAVQRAIMAQFAQLEERFKTFSLENEQRMEGIRQTVERRLTYIQQDNNQHLSEMRQIVDEKLQKTLEERMTRSFQSVSERLEQVYKGLGEMQTLAAGVGDLKKVLSNVKTRGILGEVQLGAILEEILSPEQYATNIAVRPGSKNVVEYAIRLPNEDGNFVWLPIDAKFPGDTYAALRDAYDTGSADNVMLAWNDLKARLREEAKDIRDKYIDPPNTTEFAIMFLPFEGLYAEAVNRGMIEMLQRDFRVNLSGPSTTAALLNSLQMGFRTFALQKRSSEVWKTLSTVKTEFGRFADVLQATQQRLEQANTELDKLVGVRTRQIQKALQNVTDTEALPEEVTVPELAEALPLV